MLVETFMLICLFLLALYAIALWTTLIYDVLTGRIDRLRGIAHRKPETLSPATEKKES